LFLGATEQQKSLWVAKALNDYVSLLLNLPQTGVKACFFVV